MNIASAFALFSRFTDVRRERAQIGQDLFSGQAAVPLQFPASFTFVFRAFTTLDGIGKTLDERYDLTKIAGPYLKELLDLKDGNAYVSVLKGWQKKLGESVADEGSRRSAWSFAWKAGFRRNLCWVFCLWCDMIRR